MAWATPSAQACNEHGALIPDAADPSVVAGQVARIRGLDGARIGVWIGIRPETVARSALPAPGLETHVTARDPARQGALHRALAELADIDPLIAVRPDRGAARISVYGEVQRQVLAQTLAAEYGIDADFGEAAVLCVERPWGPATVVLRMGQPGHLHNVTLGVRVEPAPPGSGVHLVVAAERSGLPLHVYSTIGGFRAAMLDYLAEPLASGPYGWPVTDLRIMVTKSAYAPAGPRAVDVRHTVADVVREAIGQAGPTVCEPVDRFTVEGPAHTLSAVLGLLVRHGAVPDAPPLRRPGRRGDRHDADRRDQHSACSPARCAARSGRAGVPPRPSRAGSAVVQERGSVMGVVGRRAVLFPAVGMVVICVCRYARWVPWPLRGPPAGSPELTVTMTLRTRCPILAGVLSVGSSPWADDR